jgi:RNA polymerase sigma-70 factor (ECF subfamily)
MAEELPEIYREPLLMADFEGLPQREVAQRLGLTLSGAKSRVQRGRALLGEHLARCCEVELDAEGRVADFRRRECDC